MCSLFSSAVFIYHNEESLKVKLNFDLNKKVFKLDFKMIHGF
jgi:hypothetical protein